MAANQLFSFPLWAQWTEHRLEVGVVFHSHSTVWCIKRSLRQVHLMKEKLILEKLPPNLGDRYAGSVAQPSFENGCNQQALAT